MKNYKEMNTTERKEVALLFSNWLKIYSNEVVIKVIKKKDEIIKNEFSMNLLIELKNREDKECKDFSHSIANLMDEFNTFKDYDVHKHPLTHANSYRDVLYDMYIKEV